MCHIARFLLSYIIEGTVALGNKRERHKNMSYKKNAAIVKKYLDDNDWNYEEQELGKTVAYKGGIGGLAEEGGVFDSYNFVLLVGEETVQSYAVMPTSAKSKLAEVAEFITRANYGMWFGNFDLDYSDGEVRFHICFPACVLQNDLEDSLNFMITGGVLMLNKYARGYMKVIMGDITPEAAIKEIEG